MNITKKNIRILMDKVFGELWIQILIPGTILLLMLLGAVSSFYPHESTFEQDLNFSLGLVGSAFYKMYEAGYESPVKWSIIILGFFIGSIYFYIGGLRDIEWEKKDNTELVTT